MLAHDLQMRNRVLLSLRPGVQDMRRKVSIMMQSMMELIGQEIPTFVIPVLYLSLKLIAVCCICTKAGTDEK